jgi:hypothetical protein
MPALWCRETHHGCARRLSGSRLSSPWVTSDDAATEMSRWRRGVVDDGNDPCWAPRGVKKWNKWQHEVRRVAEVLGASFIGCQGERRGGQMVAGVGFLTLTVLNMD